MKNIFYVFTVLGHLDHIIRCKLQKQLKFPGAFHLSPNCSNQILLSVLGVLCICLTPALI